MNRLRIRISLLTALLLTAIIGLGIVVVRLWSEVGPLRQQVRSMRTELGLLNVDDPSAAHAIQLGTGEADHWKWRLYLPPGGTYELFVYSGMIPPNDVRQNKNWYDAIRQSAGGMSGTMKDGEYVFNVELKKEGTQWKVLTFRGMGQSRSVMSVQGDWISQMMERGITSSVGPDRATSFRPGDPIHLMTLLEPVETRSGNSTFWTTPTVPANGIVVWIEQHPPSTKPAAASP